MIKTLVFVSVLSLSTFQQSLVSKDESLICKQFFVNEDDFHYTSGPFSFASLPEEIAIIVGEKRIKVPCGMELSPARDNSDPTVLRPQKFKLEGIA